MYEKEEFVSNRKLRKSEIHQRRQRREKRLKKLKNEQILAALDKKEKNS